MNSEEYSKLLMDFGIEKTEAESILKSDAPVQSKVTYAINPIRLKDSKLAALLAGFYRFSRGTVWKFPSERPDGKRKFIAVDNAGSVYVCMYDKNFEMVVYDDDPTLHRTWETCSFKKWAYLDDVVD